MVDVFSREFRLFRLGDPEEIGIIGRGHVHIFFQGIEDTFLCLIDLLEKACFIIVNRNAAGWDLLEVACRLD